MSTVATRVRLGTEIREWRARPGLSQLDLAIRAGTTQRHLSFIERGRSIPGRTMVVRLAESLELSLRERNDLLVAAGYAPIYPESDFDGPLLEPVRHALMSVLKGHEPFPAVVVNSTGHIVAANGAFEVLAEDVDPRLLQPPINAYRLALHPEGMAPRIHNFPAWARHVVEGLRTGARRSPGAGLGELLDELETYLPAMPADVDHLGFAVPLELSCRQGDLTLITTLTSFATATDVTLADLRLEAFLPADPITGDILERRRGDRSAMQARGRQG